MEYTTEEMIVGFADLARFFATTGTRDPLSVAVALQRHYERMDELAAAHGGRLVKCIGDSVLFCFPAGATNAALACAREMVTCAANGIAAELQAPEMRLGICLNAGPVVTGEFGPAGRMAFDLFGDPVNVAALLVGDGIQITKGLAGRLGSGVHLEPLEPLHRAGRELRAWRVGEAHDVSGGAQRAST